MKRATQLFVFEEQAAGLPPIEKIWRTRSEPVERFISVAESHLEIVVTSQDGKAYLTVLGPQSRATTAPIPQDAEFFGIQLRRGVYLPNLPTWQLVDDAITLPDATSRTVWLDGSAWELPTYDNADVFVNRLARAGLLEWDPVVEAALEGRVEHLSLRSVQRRVLQATGLTLSGIRQIDRALEAAELLDLGVPIAEAVELTGYADQAHLTRSLKRYVGQTPGQIVRSRLPDCIVRREPAR
jgi:AraC-like DNA-binding protein